jgi:amino acid adenylation domain-containing protein
VDGQGLLAPVLRSISAAPERAAVWFPDAVALSYGDLASTASRIAAAVGPAGTTPFAAVLAERGSVAYTAVVGVLWSGRGYCPLNPTYPTARNAHLLEQSEADVLVVDPLHRHAADAIVAECSRPVRVVSTGELPADGVAPARAGEFAYLVFTSGSTGGPKGIAITHGNALHYVTHTTRRFGYRSEDRCSQTTELTFDLSVHEVFCTLASGAALVPFTRTHMMQPATRVRQAELTVWVSVPSVAMVMRRLRALQPGAMPSLRLSLFCGEPLPVGSARAWAAAAPGGAVVNLYGPTEATVAFTEHVFDPEASEDELRNGLVPIGTPMEGLDVVVDGSGELLLGGPQVAHGYWRNTALTAERFVELPDRAGRWYRTGDVVERGEDGTLHFLGRTDSQLKIHGYRVELDEVDAALRGAVGHDLVLAVPFPVDDQGVHGLVAVLEARPGAGDPPAPRHSAILEECGRILAPYMVPSRVVSVERLPRNTNGKLDRAACLRLVEAATS